MKECYDAVQESDIDRFNSAIARGFDINTCTEVSHNLNPCHKTTKITINQSTDSPGGSIVSECRHLTLKFL